MSWGFGRTEEERQESDAAVTFAPAVPPEARTLRVTTDSGTVELELQS